MGSPRRIELFALLFLLATPQQALAQPSASSSEATQPKAGMVPLQFRPDEADRSYKVAVQAGGQVHRCNTPCTVRVAPGEAKVTVSGDATFEQKVNVSSASSLATVKRGSAGLKRAGIVLGSLGIVSMSAGVIYGVTTKQYMRSVYYFHAPAIGLALTGLILALSAGGNKIELSERSVGKAKSHGIRLSSVALSPLPRGGGLVGIGFSY